MKPTLARFPSSVRGSIATGDNALGRPRSLGLARATAGTSAWRECWAPFWRSRLLVWIVGCVAVAGLGTSSGAVSEFDPTGISSSLGRLGNILAAPAVRWDSIWYIQIAQHGYRTARETAFFPLYPLLVRIGSLLTGSTIVAGILISLVAMFAGLVIVRRLTELELGAPAARAAVTLMSFGPMALFLSAVYTESLFIALTAGSFYAARKGRWATAGIVGGLAAMTHAGGFLLVVPVALMYLYGPRADAAPSPAVSRWRPRYPLRSDLLWAAVIPAGAGLFSLYLAARGFGPAATVHAQQSYSSRAIAFPFVGVWDGVAAAWHQLRLELNGLKPVTYQSQELLQLGFLVVATIALIGTFRRLPLPYGVFAATQLLIAVSTPTVGDPLRGFDRYASMTFPLFMWAGLWAHERRALRPLLIASTALLVFFTAQFATWHWVGSPLL